MQVMIADRDLGDGEWVELATRPHWKRTVRPALLVLVLAPLATFVAGRVPRGSAQTTVRAAIVGLALLVVLLVAVRPFLRWLTTSYVVTNRRLLVRQGLVARSGRDLPLARLNDVSFTQAGLLDRILRCGDLVVESAGERGQLVLRDVPFVQRVGQEIFRLADEEVARYSRGPGSA